MTGSDPPDPGGQISTERKAQVPSTSYEYLKGIVYNGYRVIVWQKNISPCPVGRIIHGKHGNQDISHIVKNGPNSVVVHCKTAEVANKIAKDESLIAKDLKPYIPLYYVTSPGIVFDVDEDYSEEFIKENLETDHHKVHSVVRINRNEKSGTDIV
ncbi:hypothetical protein DMENIID0001_089680 [Sergentomyia squamirostris]